MDIYSKENKSLRNIWYRECILNQYISYIIENNLEEEWMDMYYFGQVEVKKKTREISWPQRTNENTHKFGHTIVLCTIWV